MRYEVLLTSKASPEMNMEMDIKLLQSLAWEERIVLHFYAWKGNCATYGYFLDPFKLLHEEQVRKHSLALARRPTGGGVIFHQWDLAFAVLIPAAHPKYALNTLQNYAWVNKAVLEAVAEFSGRKFETTLLEQEEKCLHPCFCMAKPTVFDVMLNGRKAGGAAQRRTKHGLLHQGSIALSFPAAEFLEQVLIETQAVIAAMRQNGYYLLGDNAPFKTLEEGRRELQYLLMKSLQKHLL